MRDRPAHREAHMHPAIRDRVLQVSPDLRLRSLALSGVGATKLDTTIAYFENLTPANAPDLSCWEYQMADAIAKMLRIACGRLTAWENGELPTPADASVVVDCLTQCRRSLANWASVRNGLKRL